MGTNTTKTEHSAYAASASEWKSLGRAAALDQAKPLELPSGMTILARRPDPIQIALWGQLPLGLAAAVQGGATPAAPSSADLLAGVELSRNVLSYCCVRPRISLVPAGDHEIHPRDIPMEDVLYILRWARRGEEAEALRTFRSEQSDAGAGGDGAEVRPETVDDAGDHRPGAGAGSGSGGGHGAKAQRA